MSDEELAVINQCLSRLMDSVTLDNDAIVKLLKPLSQIVNTQSQIIGLQQKVVAVLANHSVRIASLEQQIGAKPL